MNIDGLGDNGKFLPAIFDNVIKYWSINPGEDPRAYWNDKCDENVTIRQVNGGHPIPLNVFATTALVLISLPASESMVERAFSQIKAIATDFNKSMKNKLFLSLATVKLCLRYKNKYHFQEEEQ